MNFEISHPVDDSDVAFVMRLDRHSTVCSMMGSKSLASRVGTNIDAFINLTTLNYLLAGLQLCYVPSWPEKSKWFDLLHDLDQDRFSTVGHKFCLWDLRYLVRDLIKPFGVVRGSEKQGGQDETGYASSTWPVSFVCNMVLDGHDRNVVNYWHFHDINAGDDLVFRLKPMPIPRGKDGYTLNHYYKRFVQQNFESYYQSEFVRTRATHVWQLVPDVFTLEGHAENDEKYGEPIIMSPGFEVPKDFIWQEQGFWHIARSQVMVRKYATTEYYNNDMANQLKVNHLDLTFEPTWTKVPGECSEDPDRGLTISYQDGYPLDPDNFELYSQDVSNIKPGMRSSARDSLAQTKHVHWTPELRLESMLSAPPPREPAFMRDTQRDEILELFRGPMKRSMSAEVDIETEAEMDGEFVRPRSFGVKKRGDRVYGGLSASQKFLGERFGASGQQFAAKRARDRSVPIEEEPIDLVFSSDPPDLPVMCESEEVPEMIELTSMNDQVMQVEPQEDSANESSVSRTISSIMGKPGRAKKKQ